MKITKEKLKQIIKEEIQAVVDDPTRYPSISRDLYRKLRASILAVGYPGRETPPLRRGEVDRDDMLKRDFEDVVATDPSILRLTKDQHLDRLGQLSSELDDATAGLVKKYIVDKSRSRAPSAGGEAYHSLIGHLNTLLANQS